MKEQIIAIRYITTKGSVIFEKLWFKDNRLQACYYTTNRKLTNVIERCLFLKNIKYTKELKEDIAIWYLYWSHFTFSFFDIKTVLKYIDVIKIIIEIQYKVKVEKIKYNKQHLKQIFNNKWYETKSNIRR